MSWSSSGGSTSYELLARKAGDNGYTTIAENISGNTYTHTNLEAGTQYYYKIKAHNNEHSSIVSARSDAGYGYTKLNAPKITGKTANSISLDWSRGVLNGDYNYTYRIRRLLYYYDSDYTNIAIVSNSSYTDYNVEPNTAYRYYIDVLKNGEYCVHSETVDVTTDEQKATQITLNTSKIAMSPGNAYQLYATVLPTNTTNKSVSWTSSNSAVAEVSNGNVTAKSVGMVTITAKTSNGITASCSVTIDTPENLCEHSFGEWQETKSATCIDTGKRTRICGKCGKTEIEVIPTNGHSYSEEWTIVTEPTCSTYGIRKHLCNVCDSVDETTAETIDMLEHTVGDEWIIDKEATCTEVGIKYKKCTVCGTHTSEASIPITSHEYDENYIIEQSATCQQIGIEYCLCNKCKEKFYKYTDKIDHEYKMTDVCEATTTKEGYITYTCIYCDDVITETIPMLSRTAEINVANASVEIESTVDIFVSMKNNPGIISAKMTINFDNKVLSLIKVTDLGMLGTACHSLSLNSPYELYWNNGASASNFTSNGDLVSLTFKVSEKAEPGEYPISISYDYNNTLNSDMDSVFFNTVDGDITVKESATGKAPVVSVGGISFDITLDAEEYSGNIIAALYSNDGKINDLKIYPASREVKVTFEKGKTGAYAKIMWWESVSSMVPVCEVQTIMLQ